MNTNETENNVFSTGYASRAGALRAGKRNGFEVYDIETVFRDGKHFVSDRSALPVASRTVAATKPATKTIKQSKKARVLYLFQNGGAGVAEIASDLKVTTAAAQSLVSDVKRMGITLTVERKDGRAIYSA